MRDIAMLGRLPLALSIHNASTTMSVMRVARTNITFFLKVAPVCLAAWLNAIISVALSLCKYSMPCYDRHSMTYYFHHLHISPERIR